MSMENTRDPYAFLEQELKEMAAEVPEMPRAFRNGWRQAVHAEALRKEGAGTQETPETPESGPVWPIEPEAAWPERYEWSRTETPDSEEEAELAYEAVRRRGRKPESGRAPAAPKAPAAPAARESGTERETAAPSPEAPAARESGSGRVVRIRRWTRILSAAAAVLVFLAGGTWMTRNRLPSYQRRQMLKDRQAQAALVPSEESAAGPEETDSEVQAPEAAMFEEEAPAAAAFMEEAYEAEAPEEEIPEILYAEENAEADEMETASEEEDEAADRAAAAPRGNGLISNGAVPAAAAGNAVSAGVSSREKPAGSEPLREKKAAGAVSAAPRPESTGEPVQTAKPTAVIAEKAEEPAAENDTARITAEPRAEAAGEHPDFREGLAEFLEDMGAFTRAVLPFLAGAAVLTGIALMIRRKRA